MRDYIELNHKHRYESTDKNNGSMFKLMNNPLCGRCLLNKQKYNSNIKIISDVDNANKAVSKETFKDYNIIHENCSLFNIEKNYIKLDIPSYIGSCILDLSKILIYNYCIN